MTKHALAVLQLGSDLSLMVDRAADTLLRWDVIIESHSFARVGMSYWMLTVLP